MPKTRRGLIQRLRDWNRQLTAKAHGASTDEAPGLLNRPPVYENEFYDVSLEFRTAFMRLYPTLFVRGAPTPEKFAARLEEQEGEGRATSASKALINQAAHTIKKELSKGRSIRQVTTSTKPLLEKARDYYLLNSGRTHYNEEFAIFAAGTQEAVRILKRKYEEAGMTFPTHPQKEERPHPDSKPPPKII